jgi:hypothetical protein
VLFLFFVLSFFVSFFFVLLSLAIPVYCFHGS